MPWILPIRRCLDLSALFVPYCVSLVTSLLSYTFSCFLSFHDFISLFIKLNLPIYFIEVKFCLGTISFIVESSL